MIIYVRTLPDGEAIYTANQPGAEQITVPDADWQEFLAGRRRYNRATKAFDLIPEVSNGDTLRDRARQALAGNATFLALASPSNAQVVAQVRALTRQVNALIKLSLNDLADTSGT